MVTKYRSPAPAPQRGRGRAKRNTTRHRYAPDATALRATIQALWRKERRLGRFVSAEEVCLDLDGLDIEALRALRAQICIRLQQQMAAAAFTTADKPSL